MRVTAMREDSGDSVGRQRQVVEIDLSAVEQDVVLHPAKYFGPDCRAGQWSFYRSGVCYSSTDEPLGHVENSGRWGRHPF